MRLHCTIQSAWIEGLDAAPAAIRGLPREPGAFTGREEICGRYQLAPLRGQDGYARLRDAVVDAPPRPFVPQGATRLQDKRCRDRPSRR